MKVLSLATFALVAILASGQTSPPVPDACIIDCTEEVCVSLTNFTCFCSLGPQQLILSCLQANCTTADLSTAEQLDQLECIIFLLRDLTCLGPSSSSSAPAVSSSAAPSNSVSNPPTVTSATSSPSPSSSLAVFTSSASIVSNGGLAGLWALAVALGVTIGIFG